MLLLWLTERLARQKHLELVKTKRKNWNDDEIFCFSAGEKVVGLLQASTTLKMAEFLFLVTSTRYLTMRYVCAARGKASPQTNFT